MISEVIGPRRPDWRDWRYNQGASARYLRLYRREIGYGRAFDYMSATIKEEIIKCFQQWVHLSSGIGEVEMHEIVHRYFELHPDRRNIHLDLEPQSLPYMHRTVDRGTYTRQRIAPRRNNA